MRNHRGGVVQAIPQTVRPGVCCLCNRERSLCADVVFRGESRPKVCCSHCRIVLEGEWRPAEAAHVEVDLQDDPRVRRMGRGMRARSPVKNRMPFTF